MTTEEFIHADIPEVDKATEDFFNLTGYFVCKNEEEKENLIKSFAKLCGIIFEQGKKDVEKELAEKDAIINFLKKELMHKTSYRQVMKRQYRELKQQKDADNKRHAEMYADLVQKNFLLRKEIEELKKESM